MKRLFLIFFIIFSNIYSTDTSQSQHRFEITSYIKGSIIFRNFSITPNHALITLEDLNGEIIDDAPFVVGTNFYFFNPPQNEYYNIKIEYGNQVKNRTIFVDEDVSDIGNITLVPNLTDRNKNDFILVMFIFSILINTAALFFFRKRANYIYEKSMVNSIFFFNLGSIILFLSFLLSFNKEVLGSRLIYLDILTENFFFIFILRTIIYYPKKTKNKLVLGLYYIFIFLQIISIPAVLAFVNPNLLEALFHREYYLWFSLLISIFTVAFSDILFYILTTLFLLYNIWRFRKNTKENKPLIYFLTSLLILTIKIVNLFLLPENLKGYLGLYIENIDFFIFVLIVSLTLVNNIGHRFSTKNSFFNNSLLKLLKYFISFNITYLVLSFFEQAYIAYLFLSGVILSDILSYLYNYTINNRIKNIEKISDSLELSRTQEEFKKILKEELSNFSSYRNFEYIFINSEEELESYTESKGNLRVLKKESFKEPYKNYDYLIKTFYNNKTVGIMLIDNYEKLICSLQLEFLVNLNNAFAPIAKNLRLKKLKNTIKENVYLEKTSKEKTLEETIFFNLQFIKLIEKQVSEWEGPNRDKIKAYCSAMKNKIEELEGGN